MGFALETEQSPFCLLTVGVQGLEAETNLRELIDVNQETLREIVGELEELLPRRFLGKGSFSCPPFLWRLISVSKMRAISSSALNQPRLVST